MEENYNTVVAYNKMNLAIQEYLAAHHGIDVKDIEVPSWAIITQTQIPSDDRDMYAVTTYPLGAGVHSGKGLLDIGTDIMKETFIRSQTPPEKPECECHHE